MTKRLYKSRTNRMISGVCGGVAEYFNIDPSLVRLIWVLVAFGGGAGIIAYIAAAIILPDAPFDNMPPPPGPDNNSNQGNGPW